MSANLAFVTRILLAAALLWLTLGANTATASPVIYKLAWDAADGAKGYEVHYGLQPGAPYTGTFATEGPSPVAVPDTEATLSNGPSCKTAYFAVLTVAGDLKSVLTGEVSVKKPYSPNEISVAEDGASVLIQWEGTPTGKESEVDAYQIYYDTDESGEPYEGKKATEGASPIRVQRNSLPDSDNPAFRLTGLGGAERIYVMVSAQCFTGEQNKSDEVELVFSDAFKGLQPEEPDAGTAADPTGGEGMSGAGGDDGGAPGSLADGGIAPGGADMDPDSGCSVAQSPSELSLWLGTLLLPWLRRRHKLQPSRSA